MSFDHQAAFAALAEKERVKGHHSPEGQAIRILSRALSGYSAGALSGRDVALLVHQAVVDWLKQKLGLSAWSTAALPELIAQALERSWMTGDEAARLDELETAEAARELSPADVHSMLEFSIALLDRHW